MYYVLLINPYFAHCDFHQSYSIHNLSCCGFMLNTLYTGLLWLYAQYIIILNHCDFVLKTCWTTVIYNWCGFILNVTTCIFDCLALHYVTILDCSGLYKKCYYLYFGQISLLNKLLCWTGMFFSYYTILDWCIFILNKLLFVMLWL